MNPKRIAFFAGDLHNFRFLKDIVSVLQKRSWEIRLVTSQVSLEQMAEIMNWSDITWFEWGLGPVKLGSKLPKTCRTICRIHKYEILEQSIREVNWENIDDLIFVSQAMQDLFLQLHGEQLSLPNNLHVVPNAINLAQYPFKERQHGTHLACIARLHSDKNLAWIPQIMKKLVAINPEYQISILGAKQQALQLLYLQKLSKELGLENHIHYEGTCEDIAAWLDDKNILLMPSIIEGHPVSVIEAMALGIKPILHDYIGDPANMFGEQFVFKTIDEAVALIDEKDYDSKLVRQIVEERYRLKTQMEGLDAIFNQDLIKQTTNCSISIGIITYNRLSYLKEAVESALSQSYDHFEVIVIDDGSKDETETWCRSIQDQRFRYIRKDHEGAPQARNHLIAAANSDYIIWLDSDDIMYPGALEHYAKYIELYPEADVFYSDLEFFDAQGHRFNRFFKDHYENDHILASLIMTNQFPNAMTMVSKSLYDRYGGYDVSFTRAHDYELWTRLGSRVKYKNTSCIAGRYRLHSGNISGDLKHEVDRQYEVRIIDRLLEEHALSQLFPDLKWEDEVTATPFAYVKIAQIYEQWGANEKALDYYQKANAVQFADAKINLEIQRRIKLIE